MKKTLRLNLAFILVCIVAFYGSIAAQGLIGSPQVQSEGEVVAAAYSKDFFCTASTQREGYIALEGTAAHGETQRIVFKLNNTKGAHAVALAGYKVQVRWNEQNRELSVAIVEDKSLQHSGK